MIGIVDDFRLALHFLRQLLAECDFLLQGVEVHTLADIAVADFLGVSFSCPRRTHPPATG